MALEGNDGDVACQRDLRVFFTCPNVRNSLDPQMNTYSSENSGSTGMQQAFCYRRARFSSWADAAKVKMSTTGITDVVVPGTAQRTIASRLAERALRLLVAVPVACPLRRKDKPRRFHRRRF